MNLEKLLEMAGKLPLERDTPYYDVYNSKTCALFDFSYFDERLKRIKEGRFAVFSSQGIMYSDGDAEVVFYIEPVSPDALVIPLLRPDTERTYLVSAYSSRRSETEKIPREEASYVIKGSFVEDKFVANEAVEAVYEKPIKIADLPLEQANVLMNFLRGSNLFPQNEREELIAAGIWASRFSHLIPEGSPLEKHLEEMQAYAKLLEG